MRKLLAALALVAMAAGLAGCEVTPIGWHPDHHHHYEGY